VTLGGGYTVKYFNRSVALTIAALSVAACASRDSDHSAGGDVGSTASAFSGGPKLIDVDVRNYELDMEHVRKWLAGMEALMSAAKSDTSIAAAVASNGQETTQQSIAKLDANDRARELLRQAGLTPREYVLTMTAYLQAATADAAQRASPPGKAPSDVNPKNVEFIRDHRSELEPLINKAGLSPTS